MVIKDVLVCVTRQISCERLIKEGARLVNENEKLHVVNVSPDGKKFLGEQHQGGSRTAEALEYLFEISKNYGAYMTVVRSENVAKALAGFLNQNKIALVILGASNDEKSIQTLVHNIKRDVKHPLEIRILPIEE